MLLALLALALFMSLALTGAFSAKLVFQTYSVNSARVTKQFRILAICDLHDRPLETKGAPLIERLKKQKPDLICLGGDIFDERRDHDATMAFLLEAKEICPVFFVPGNHEFKTGEADKIKRKLSIAGIHLSTGSHSPLEFLDGEIRLYGIDDPRGGGFFGQLRDIGKALDQEAFNILLSHRPEYFDIYSAYGFDLVISGHAHGGQWRIPKIANGIYAPGQGLLPKYAGGLYKDGRTAMAVSRGLSDLPKYMPRIYNPPEIVIIDILPKA